MIYQVQDVWRLFLLQVIMQLRRRLLSPVVHCHELAADAKRWMCAPVRRFPSRKASFQVGDLIRKLV